MKMIDLSETITTESVMYIGERLAIRAFKNFFKYAYDTVHGLYVGLIRDIERQNMVNHTFSDGYDFAQIASCFLCGHIGKKLDDVLGTDKNGVVVTVKIACLRLLGREISKKLADTRRSVCIDEVYEQKTIATLDCEPINDDDNESVVDEIIEKMKLTDKQKEALLCRMDGKSLREMVRILSVSYTVIWTRLSYVRKKYLSLYSEPKFRAGV